MVCGSFLFGTCTNMFLAVFWQYLRENKKRFFPIYLLIIFVLYFQTWSNALHRHASEILQCSTESSELSQNSLTVNYGQGVSIHEIINKWFREIQHLYPYEASCLDFSQCSNILTVCKLSACKTIISKFNRYINWRYNSMVKTCKDKTPLFTLKYNFP